LTAADTIRDLHVEVKRCADCGARFGVESAFCPFDGTPLSMGTWDKSGDPRAQVTVDGRYEVLEPLGEGGMGTVYKVRHITLDRRFAMKVLRRDLAADADLAVRFLQEARATAAIKHPSVVAITDFGTMDDGVPYFVMELLEGETLAACIRRRGPVSPATASRIARRIADALTASHAANVIHRDLKPDNVFLVGKNLGKAPEDEIRVVDFGAAKIVGGSKLTRPGMVFGTPYYMSPEQASGQPLDAYEMITGRVPFEADTYLGVLEQHLFQAPPRPASPSGLPLGELEDVLMRALEKVPPARYSSMREFASALERAEAGQTPESPKALDRSASRTMMMGSMTTADRIERSVTRSIAAEAHRRRRRGALGAGAACAALAIGGAIVATRMQARTTATSPARTADLPAGQGASTEAVAAPVGFATDPMPSAAPPAPPSEPGALPMAVLPASNVVAAKRSPPPAASQSPKRAAPTATSPAPRAVRGTDDFNDPWKR
jgi:eukaryotic-like serine/threonine-protein kinase